MVFPVTRQNKRIHPLYGFNYQESKWWIVAISIQTMLLVLVIVVWENVREIVILMNTAKKDWHVGIAVVGMMLFLLDVLEPLTLNLTITVMIHQKNCNVHLVRVKLKVISMTSQ